jgi:hypothetical protein
MRSRSVNHSTMMFGVTRRNTHSYRRRIACCTKHNAVHSVYEMLAQLLFPCTDVVRKVISFEVNENDESPSMVSQRCRKHSVAG